MISWRFILYVFPVSKSSTGSPLDVVEPSLVLPRHLATDLFLFGRRMRIAPVVLDRAGRDSAEKDSREENTADQNE